MAKLSELLDHLLFCLLLSGLSIQQLEAFLNAKLFLIQALFAKGKPLFIDQFILVEIQEPFPLVIKGFQPGL